MAKGQTEILGIAIVIVLLLMGLIFLLRFSTPEEDSILKERLRRAQVANNVLNAMLRTSDTNCDPIKKPRIEELLIDCGENPGLGPGGSVVCKGINGNKQSCQYVKELIEKEILKKTVEQWKLGYELTALIGGNVIGGLDLHKTSDGKPGKCPATSEVDSQTYLLPLTTTLLKLTLRICA